MSGRKIDGILSLNVKKLLILHLVWITNWILQYRSLFFIMQLILLPIWRDNFAKYGGAITKYFLGIILTTDFGASILSKTYLMHLSTKSRGWLFLYKIFFNLSISSWNLIKSKQKLSHRTRNDLVQPHVSGKTFEDSINPSEGLFFIDLSCKFLVFRKNDNI